MESIHHLTMSNWYMSTRHDIKDQKTCEGKGYGHQILRIRLLKTFLKKKMLLLQAIQVHAPNPALVLLIINPKHFLTAVK